MKIYMTCPITYGGHKIAAAAATNSNNNDDKHESN